MQTEPIERFTASRPCPICDGHKDLPAGEGRRCYGLLDSGGKYARCTREEHAGALTLNTDATYSHRLEGPCRCGKTHGMSAPQADPNGSGPVTRHEIRSMDGEIVCVHARRGRGPQKQVWWEGLGGAKPVDLLYRAQMIAQAPQDAPVVLCEGEPAADALASLGLVVVGTVCGASAGLSARAAAMLAAREVWCWPDADDIGRAHMERNALVLRAAGARVRFIRWEDAPTKGDAADYVGAGGTAEGVAAMVDGHAPSGPYIDWPSFWAADESGPDWLLPNILARGRGHSIFAGHKTGKSLVMLWCALELVRAGRVVIYLDYEMTDADLRERLEDMGAGPEVDLSLLRYALLPYLPPLDSREGGKALITLIEAEIAAHPGKDIALVIDTIGRAVQGEENPSDTIRAFYSYTGIELKRRGVTWVRLDHAGWDESHARGSSAKGDDVDVIWKLSEVDGGRKLERKAARMGWVPDEVILRMEEAPLRFEITDEGWPFGTYDTAAKMDELWLPLDVGTRPAQRALQEAGHGRRRAVVVAAVKWRQICATSGSGALGTTSTPIPEPASEPHMENGLNSEWNQSGTTGNQFDRAREPVGPYTEGIRPPFGPRPESAYEPDDDPDGFPF